MGTYCFALNKFGRSGKLVFTSNFGFGFTAALIEQVPHRRIASLSARRDKVIKLLSDCHQADLQLMSEPEEYDDDGNSYQFRYYACFQCRKRTDYPHEIVDREYPSLDAEAAQIFTSAITALGVYELDAVLIADKILDTLADIWGRINAGERLQTILKSYSGNIPL